MKIVYRRDPEQNKTRIMRINSRDTVQIGVIMPDAAGNVGVKLAAFVIMSPAQVAELNRQVGSLDREVKRKNNSTLIF